MRLKLTCSIVLIATAALALYRLAPPAHDSDGFSTDAALSDLGTIALEPRPIGSPRNGVVRDFIVTRFESFGYETRVANGIVFGRPIKNIVARRAGTSEIRKSVLLAAHYDSVRAGPGAADDGAAVAALLEVARILASTPHRNDIALLITDGEETGLLGARAFVEHDDPLLKDVGVVLNFDARGTSGPSIMFETSPGNGWLIDLFARTSRHPVCSSLTRDVYKRMPNGTDFTVFRELGKLQGLNFAFIGGHENYHTATDDLAHLDARSLRDQGIQALRAARELLEIDLSSPPRTDDDVYFDVLSLCVVRYPMRWNRAISFAASAWMFCAVALSIVRRRATPARLAVTSAMLLASIVSAVLVSWMLARWIDRATLLHHESAMIIMQVAISIAAVWGAQRVVRTDCVNAITAAVLLWAILNLVIVSTIPGASYLSAWPGAFVALGMAGALAVEPRHARWVLAASAIPAVLLAPPIVYLACQALTPAGSWVVMAIVVPMLWLLPLWDSHAADSRVEPSVGEPLGVAS